ncbi:hypothetical protein HK096_001354 [Nowakowskiella sp. JEL0078]|nr:hypothetical protein HK096_001354 [Nowakowskiella sp. JEL0078]
MATASRDRLVHIFDISQDRRTNATKFEIIQTLDDHSSSVTSVRFAEGGRRLISCAADKSGNAIPEFATYHFAANRCTVYDLELDPTHRLALCASQDRRLNIYSVPTGKQIRSFKPDDNLDTTGGLLKVASDPSGSFAATASADKCIRIFDLFSGSCTSRVAGHSELITSIKFTSDGTRLISSGGDGCIMIWKLNTSSVQKSRIASLSPSPQPSRVEMNPELKGLNEQPKIVN